MWTIDDELRLTVLMGLRSGLKLCRGMRRALTEGEQTKVARIIVETLVSYNWRIERGPPVEGASGLVKALRLSDGVQLMALKHRCWIGGTCGKSDLSIQP